MLGHTWSHSIGNPFGVDEGFVEEQMLKYGNPRCSSASPPPNTEGWNPAIVTVSECPKTPSSDEKSVGISALQNKHTTQRTTITGPTSSFMVNLPNLVVNYDGYDSEDHEIGKAS